MTEERMVILNDITNMIDTLEKRDTDYDAKLAAQLVDNVKLIETIEAVSHDNTLVDILYSQLSVMANTLCSKFNSKQDT